MKHFISFLCAFGMLGIATAAEVDEWAPDYWQVSSVLDSSLSTGHAVYEFKFTNVPQEGSHRIIYSIDGIAYTKKLHNNKLIIASSAGEHVFQFYYSQDYAEVYTSPLPILDRYHDTYEVQLTGSMIMQISDKPVIYLYPERETAVSVKMDIAGETTFTYPYLDESWDFTAFPNGDLQFGDDTYNYLFWESNQNHYLNHVEMTEGFVIQKDQMVSFLEGTLSQAGLSSKEKADFITYWGPRLAANELTFIHFEFNEACDKYAKMAITPEPDHIYRIYMSWMGINEPMKVSPQKIEKMNREGFSVLEWGGSEVVSSKIAQTNFPVK